MVEVEGGRGEAGGWWWRRTPQDAAAAAVASDDMIEPSAMEEDVERDD